MSNSLTDSTLNQIDALVFSKIHDFDIKYSFSFNESDRIEERFNFSYSLKVLIWSTFFDWNKNVLSLHLSTVFWIGEAHAKHKFLTVSSYGGILIFEFQKQSTIPSLFSPKIFLQKELVCFACGCCNGIYKLSHLLHYNFTRRPRQTQLFYWDKI